MIILLWAQAENCIIGNDDQLSWHDKEELAHFRNTTLNQTILMGRKTFASLPETLKRRKIIVVSKNQNFNYNNSDSDVVIEHDLDYVLSFYQGIKGKDLYVCGGSEIYQQALPLAERLIVSKMKFSATGNVYFPKVNWDDFKLTKTVDSSNFTVEYYERNW